MPLPLPVVHLSDTPEQQLVQQLRDACCVHGFFLVTGHGVPQQLVESTLEALQQFFALPQPTKSALHHNTHAKGYMAWGQQTLDIGAQSCADTKETWAVMDPSLSVPPDHPDAFTLPFHSPNQWPHPADLPHFREVVEELVGHMKGLRDRVNQLLAQVLGQPRDFFEPFFSHQPLDMLRGFHYHCAQGSDPDKGVFGAGAHTDWGHLTYLMTGGSPGLQIHYKGTWQDLPHVPGAFVCNIADLLQLWSGGRFKSTRHRVVVSPGVHRYSCAYFTVPHWNAWVMPLKPTAAAAAAAGSAASQVAHSCPHSEAADACASVQETAATTAAAAPGAAAAASTEAKPDVNAAQQVVSAADGAAAAAAVSGSVVGGEASGVGRLSGVEVTAEGCSLAPGAAGVRVTDYIQAKYEFHFQDAGKKD